MFVQFLYIYILTMFSFPDVTTAFNTIVIFVPVKME
jgi:hypothetical protein